MTEAHSGDEMVEAVEIVEVTEGDDNRHPREYEILVNGRKKIVHHEHVTFEEVVRLAHEVPPIGSNVTITVTYSHAAERPASGTLIEGQRVKIHNGTRFNVVTTDKS